MCKTWARSIFIILLCSTSVLSAEQEFQKDMELADSYLTEGQFDAAQQLYQQWYVHRPDLSAAFFLNWGNSHYLQADYLEALQSYLIGWKQEPHNRRLLQNIHMSQQALGLPVRLPERSGLTSLFPWFPLLPQWMWGVIFIGFSLIFWTLLILARLKRLSAPLWLYLLLSIVVALCFSSLLAYGQFGKQSYAILQQESYLFSGNSPYYDVVDNKPLEPGRIFIIHETRQDWYRVKWGSSYGWLSEESILFVH